MPRKFDYTQLDAAIVDRVTRGAGHAVSRTVLLANADIRARATALADAAQPHPLHGPVTPAALIERRIEALRKASRVTQTQGFPIGFVTGPKLQAKESADEGDSPVPGMT